MIRLKTDPWCEDCGEFSPNIEQNTSIGNDGFVCNVDTFITCKSANRCRRVMRYLKAKAKKEECKVEE